MNKIHTLKDLNLDIFYAATVVKQGEHPEPDSFGAGKQIIVEHEKKHKNNRL